MTEGGPFGKMGVGRCRALRRFPCPAPGPRPSPGRRCVGFRFAARSPIGVGDDGRGAISEGGCWSMSGVEAAFAGAMGYVGDDPAGPVGTEGCAVSAPPAHRHRATTRDRPYMAPVGVGLGGPHLSGRPARREPSRGVSFGACGQASTSLILSCRGRPHSSAHSTSLPGSADSEEKECSWAYNPPFARRS